MVEFAPNASGPAHIGTLRSYLAAWTMAKKTNQPLCLRFDMGQQPASNRWANEFLKELTLMEISPDRVCRHDTTMAINFASPEWITILSEQLFDGSWTEVACYEKLRPPFNGPSWDPADYRPGQPIPLSVNATDDIGGFAGRAEGGGWSLISTSMAVIQMQLRQTKTIFRSSLSGYIRYYGEEQFAEHFGFLLPQEIETSVIATDDAALSKSNLKPCDPGTVGHALETLGPELLRDRVEHHIAIAPLGVYHWQEVIG